MLYDNMPIALDLTSDEDDEEILKEIMEILCKQGLTVNRAFRVLEDARKMLPYMAKLRQNEESKEKIFYLCDGEVKKCKKKSCYESNGVCNYTSDIKYAKNFHKTNAPYPVFYENVAASGEPDTTTEAEY